MPPGRTLQDHPKLLVGAYQLTEAAVRFLEPMVRRIGPLLSLRSARWMRENIPAMHIPDRVLDRLRQAPAGKQDEEGARICIEIIEQIHEIEGAAGIHIMACRQEDRIAEIIERAGLLPRRGVRPRPRLHAVRR